VTKPELGTKRLCGNCGTKFYDLSKSPIVCPKCATVFQVAATPASRSRPEPVAAVAPVVRAPVKEPEVEVPETQGAEFVSLEEADAESQGAKAPAAEGAEGEDEIELDEPLDDAALIETEEEGDEDVTDIVGEGREDEEET
jgi:uncharacterized protein (TIGR02300 family)